MSVKVALQVALQVQVIVGAVVLGVAAPALAQEPVLGVSTRAVQGNRILGSVPPAVATTEPLRLTIGDAIFRALDTNLGILTARQDERHAEGTRDIALSAFAPNISGRLTDNWQTLNLAVFGFPRPAGVPPVVGPFNVFDARLSVQQALWDLKARNELTAERHNVEASGYELSNIRALVILASGDAYLRALAAARRAESAQAQLTTAQALLDLSTDLKAGGIVAGIDVLRAQLQVSTERQRATAASNDAEKAKLRLAYMVGLPPAQPFVLVDELPEVPGPQMPFDEALAQALKTRTDYLAAVERVQAAEAMRRAAEGEFLPTVRVNADYGALGNSPASAAQTYSVAGTVNVPIFQGAKRQGRVLEADATLRMRQAEADSLKSAIAYELRSILLDVAAAQEQLTVAVQARDLAAQQLAQARDRLSAGVGNSIEVVQAQEAVTVASEQYINALYALNTARAGLVRGLGITEETVKRILGGAR